MRGTSRGQSARSRTATTQTKDTDWETKEIETLRDGQEIAEEKDQVVYPALVELIEEAEYHKPEDGMAGLIMEWARILTRLEDEEGAAAEQASPAKG